MGQSTIWGGGAGGVGQKTAMRDRETGADMAGSTHGAAGRGIIRLMTLRGAMQKDTPAT